MTALSALCSIRSSLWFLGEGNNVLLLLRKKSQALLSVAAVMANIPWEDDLHTPIYFFATTIQIILLPLFRNWSCETILWSKFDPMFWDKNVYFCDSLLCIKLHEDFCEATWNYNLMLILYFNVFRTPNILIANISGFFYTMWIQAVIEHSDSSYTRV